MNLIKRKLLNFGHTFGHAIESATNYKIPHGICVAYSCLMSFGFLIKDYLTNKDYLICEKIIKLIINKSIKFNIQKFRNAILRDKKANKDKCIYSFKRMWKDVFKGNEN